MTSWRKDIGHHYPRFWSRSYQKSSQVCPTCTFREWVLQIIYTAVTKLLANDSPACKWKLVCHWLKACHSIAFKSALLLVKHLLQGGIFYAMHCLYHPSLTRLPFRHTFHYRDFYSSNICDLRCMRKEYIFTQLIYWLLYVSFESQHHLQST